MTEPGLQPNSDLHWFWGGPLANKQMRTDGRQVIRVPVLVDIMLSPMNTDTLASPSFRVGWYLKNRFGSYEYMGLE